MSLLELLSNSHSWYSSASIYSNEYAGMKEGNGEVTVHSSTENQKSKQLPVATKALLETKKVLHREEKQAKQDDCENEEVADKSEDSKANSTKEVPSTSGMSKISKLLSRKTKKSLIVKKKTLLELSKLYQRLMPERWAKRDRERQELFHEVESEFSKKLNMFLDWYYKRQDQLAQEKKKTEPHIVFQLKYQTTKETKTDVKITPCEKLYENYSIHEMCKKKEEASFNLFDKLVALVDDDPVNDEFHITVVKGKQLLSCVPSQDCRKFDKCKLKCFIYAGDSKPAHVMKSHKIPISKSGKALWNHVFALREYTVEDLQMSYIRILVTAKNDDEKIVVGNITMAGKQAKIWEENSKTFREPVKSEIIHWEEAVMSPFRTIYTRTDLAQDQTPP